MMTKFKIGDCVKVTRAFKTDEGSTHLAWIVDMNKYVGGVWQITGFGPEGHVQLDGLWYFYPFVLERVGKPHAARILTEKVTINGVPCRKILGFEGILGRDGLPEKYLEGKPRFAFCLGTMNRVQLWDGKRFVSGVAMAEPGHVDLDVPDDKWIKGTCNIMFRGDVWPETHFQEYLAWLKRAGSRLAKIREQEKAAWSGKETVEI